MTRKNDLHSFFLILTGIWFGWTLLVDIFVIPSVFATVEDFFLAGDLGIAVFSKLNHLEVILSTFLLVIISFKVIKNKKLLPLLGLTFLTWAIAMIYFSYLTPKLIELTNLWKKADLMGLTALAGISDVQQEHQFYHNLYIRIDVVKLLLLSSILFMGVWKEEQWR